MLDSKFGAYLVGRCNERKAAGWVDMQIGQNALAFVHLDILELVGRRWTRNQNLYGEKESGLVSNAFNLAGQSSGSERAESTLPAVSDGRGERSDGKMCTWARVFKTDAERRDSRRTLKGSLREREHPEKRAVASGALERRNAI